VGKRNGRRVGFPRFRKKNGARQSVRFTTGAIRVDDRTHVVLPRMGRIRTHEPTTALVDLLAAGCARILSATLSYEGGRWYVAFTCAVERAARWPAYPESVIGADAGIRHLAVLSTGETVENPRPLRKAMRKIARLNRKLARRQPGSRRWCLTRHRLARAHARAGHIRVDAMHKLTSKLARTHGTIVVERLNVAGMIRNRRLARAIADAGLSVLRRQLSYKCPWNGSTLIEAHRWYPSSKTCSRCGAVKATLPLGARVFRCEHCDLVVERDLNAARNLAALAAAVAGSGPETHTARGWDVSPGAAGQTRRKREAGSGSPQKTGTAVPQGTAA
jgi:putative transposase